jgi:hypothetical protein
VAVDRWRSTGGCSAASNNRGAATTAHEARHAQVCFWVAKRPATPRPVSTTSACSRAPPELPRPITDRDTPRPTRSSGERVPAVPSVSSLALTVRSCTQPSPQAAPCARTPSDDYNKPVWPTWAVGCGRPLQGFETFSHVTLGVPLRRGLEL